MNAVSLNQAREAYHLSCAYLDHAPRFRGVWEIDPDEYQIRFETESFNPERRHFLPPPLTACKFIKIEDAAGRRVFELTLPLVEDDLWRMMRITHSVLEGLRMFCHPHADDPDQLVRILDFAYSQVKHPPYPKMMSWGGVGRFGMEGRVWPITTA